MFTYIYILIIFIITFLYFLENLILYLMLFHLELKILLLKILLYILNS